MTTMPRPAPPRSFLPFLTPVRGHAFASAPPGRTVPVARGQSARLQREPDNPADELAVSVWATGGGAPWRIGYLERAVAARIAPQLDAGLEVSATLAGWWDAPSGRWRRPVVALEPAAPPRLARRGGRDAGVWGRAPAAVTRPVGRS